MLLVAVGLGAGVGADACVVADPPTDLPSLPEMRPTIVRGSVVPSASAVLGVWPRSNQFFVPVELIDPRATIWFTAFVDYNSITGAGLSGEPRTSEFTPASTQGRVRMLEVLIEPPSDDRCHVVEVVVALRFKSVTDSRNAHTPDAPGGDSVTWFYSPGGDFAGCPVLDAGLPKVLDDAGSSDGGPP